MTGVCRNTIRASRTICTRSTPGIAASSGAISGGNRSVRITMSCDGITKRSGLSAVVHPVDDRRVARARHAGERDDQRQRQHQRRDARRRPARRLNQAVGGQRAFDRPHPLQDRPQRPRQRRATAAGRAAARPRSPARSRRRTRCAIRRATRQPTETTPSTAARIARARLSPADST